MALLQITTIPIGTSSTSLSSFVVMMQEKLIEYGASFEMHDMSTIIEGNIDELLAIVRALHEIPFAAGATRVVTQISIDDRRDKEVALGDKTQSVQSKLNRS